MGQKRFRRKKSHAAMEKIRAALEGECRRGATVENFSTVFSYRFAGYRGLKPIKIEKFLLPDKYFIFLTNMLVKKRK